MVKLLIIFLCIGILNFASAQEVRKYFDADGNPAEPGHAAFFSVGKQNKQRRFYDSLISYYTRTNTIMSVEVRDKYGNRIGDFRSFYENRKLKSHGRYDRRKFKIFQSSPDSTEFTLLEFYDSLGHPQVKKGQGFVNGKLEHQRESGKIIDGLKDSVWTVFSADGNIFSHESWKEGELIDGISYRDGKEFYYQFLLVLPQPANGFSGFFEKISDTMVYPKEAEKRGIDGKVILEFMVENDGTITSIHIVQGLGFGCEDAAVKALTSSPPWIPCLLRGQPVRHAMTVPFLFKLN